MSDWYSRKLGLTHLPRHDRKVASDEKIICNSFQWHKGENKDYCVHFSMIFEATIKFFLIKKLNCFCKTDIGKSGSDGFTGLQRKTDIRYEFNMKVILKGLECK